MCVQDNPALPRTSAAAQGSLAAALLSTWHCQGRCHCRWFFIYLFLLQTCLTRCFGSAVVPWGFHVFAHSAPSASCMRRLCLHTLPPKPHYRSVFLSLHVQPSPCSAVSLQPAQGPAQATRTGFVPTRPQPCQPSLAGSWILALPLAPGSMLWPNCPKTTRGLS